MIDQEPLNRIVGHVDKLRSPLTRRGFRLAHLRLIIRLAQGEYEKELSEWESLNSIKADPSMEVPV